MSTAPISAGCRLPWEKMNRLIIGQGNEVCAVHRPDIIVLGRRHPQAMTGRCLLVTLIKWADKLLTGRGTRSEDPDRRRNDQST
jgi:hypothetical protein